MTVSMLRPALCIIILGLFFPGKSQTTQASGTSNLPDRYVFLLEKGLTRIEKKWKAHASPSLQLLEQGQPFGHFPHAILVPAVLYARNLPVNKHYGDKRLLEFAMQLGDFLVTEYRNGNYAARHDSDWDTYMWLEAYRLLEKELGEERRKKWKEALLLNLEALWEPLQKYQDYPWYNAPFIVTSPNHYAIYASSLLVAGHVFGKKEWIALATKVLHRFCTREQTADGYWGEHSAAGPTTGYDYVTVTQIALYLEYTKDPVALKALQKSTNFHSYFTYPDGTPVETINDRNRYWGVSMWGHFGFSNFSEGRRYASFLTRFFPDNGDTSSYGGDMQSLGRIAQNLLYYHDGTAKPIPQDSINYHSRMNITAGIRKRAGWVTTYSGIIAPAVALNNFFLDRQGNFSVFHEKTGLIITGANSKRQPGLATFTETFSQDSVHMPVSSYLSMNTTTDTLALAYNLFFSYLEFPFSSFTADKMSFNIRTKYKWGDGAMQLNLQLILKAGEEIETGGGLKEVLGDRSILWTGKDLGGWIRHHGWTFYIPDNMEFRWPVFPFNPYQDAPETSLDRAIGRLSVSLPQADQEFSFTLETR